MLPTNYDFHLLSNNCTVQPQKTVTLLGVMLDQHFTLGPHIDNVVYKCHGLLRTFARATPHVPRQLLNYHTWQLSDLTWNIVVLYSCLQPRLALKTGYHSTYSRSYYL